ncbi:MAG: hypothetical protein MJZ63_02895 [Muribaculaceae bacterium]|nr:hypothetical protein [Muribaculaceae bacterium]
MNNRFTAFLGVGLLSLSSLVQAQDYDDIYFDGKEAPKREEKVITTPVRATQTSTTTMSTTPGRYRIPVNTGSSASRSDDEYNRRGAYSRDVVLDTIANDSTQMTDGKFANTERIERFYNPNIVKGSNDEELITLYYDTTPTVNIVIGNTFPTFAWGFGTFYDPWFDPWYGPGWGWGWHHTTWFHPWYDPWYGPGWAWHHHHWYDPWRHPWYYPGHHWGWHDSRPRYLADHGRRPNGSNYHGGLDVGGGRRPGYAGGGVSSGARRPASSNGGYSGGRTYGSTNVSGGRPGYATGGNVGNVGGGTSVGRRPSSTTSSSGSFDRRSTYGTQQPSRSSYDSHATTRSYDRTSTSNWGGGGRSSGGYSGGGFSGGGHSGGGHSGGGGFSGGGGRRR